MLYASSLSDAAWGFIAPLFESYGFTDKLRTYPIRTVVDACLYVVDNGIKWRNLPHDFPPWKTVYHYFRLWSLQGLWWRLNRTLVEAVRFAHGREESPSLASIDSQSQTGEPGIEERGIDGGKKINGRKRHIAVDVNGLLLECVCTSANTPDATSGEELADSLNDMSEFPRLEKILGDSAYHNVGAKLRVPVSIEASMRREGSSKGFVPEAFRWVVERTFAWLNRSRRLVRNYEKKIVHQESMNFIGNIKLCLKKLLKWLN